jgi:hypothetical protein
MASDQELRNAVVNYLLKNTVTGSHKQTINTVVDRAAIASHDEGQARELIDEMLSDPASPIEGYGGGGRQNIRLIDLQSGANYLKANDGPVPWGWE